MRKKQCIGKDTGQQKPRSPRGHAYDLVLIRRHLSKRRIYYITPIINWPRLTKPTPRPAAFLGRKQPFISDHTTRVKADGSRQIKKAI